MCLAGATHLRSKMDMIRRARCAAPRARGNHPLKRGRHSHRLKTSAAHRSAAMAGGARPDPFRTRKLSRRAPMVLRGQPVGEQGAADRWTALDPYQAGSGAGGAAGDPLRRPPFLFLHIVQPRALRGPFPCRGDLRPSAASPGRPFAGRREPSISAAGAGRRLPRGASCGHREGPAVQLPGAGPASMSPLPSEKKSPGHPSSARPSPGMGLRALSPPLI